MSFKEHNGMVLAEHCKSFCLAAANGSEEVVQLMWNEASETQRFVILHEQSFAFRKAFRKASINGHLSIVQLLWSAANDHQRRELLSDVAIGAFIGAAAQGRLEILNYLWSGMNKESKKYFSDILLGPCLAESLRNNRSAVFAFLLHLTGLDVADLRRAVMVNNAEVFVEALSSAGGSFAKCFTLLNMLSEEQKTIVLKMVRSEVPEKVWNMFVKEKEENPQAKDPCGFWESVYSAGAFDDLIAEIGGHLDRYRRTFQSRVDLRPHSRKTQQVRRWRHLLEIRSHLQTKRLLTQAETDMLQNEIRELERKAMLFEQLVNPMLSPPLPNQEVSGDRPSPVPPAAKSRRVVADPVAPEEVQDDLTRPVEPSEAAKSVSSIFPEPEDSTNGSTASTSEFGAP